MNIVRVVAGVAVGYIAMAVVVFASFFVAYMVLGPEGSYAKAGSWAPSTTWLIMSFAAGLVAAIIGGLVAALIAVRGLKAPIVLAVLLLLVGLGMGFVQTNAEPPPAKPAVRPDNVTFMDAAAYSEQPAIATWLNPFIGAVGVLIGARLRGSAKKSMS